MNSSHFLAASSLSIAMAFCPLHAAPPQPSGTTPSGPQGPAAASGKRHVVTHPVMPDDSPQAPATAGSPGTEPNGSNTAQSADGNNDAQVANGDSNAQSLGGTNSGQHANGGNNGANPGASSPGLAPADE